MNGFIKVKDESGYDVFVSVRNIEDIVDTSSVFEYTNANSLINLVSGKVIKARNTIGHIEKQINNSNND